MSKASAMNFAQANPASLAKTRERVSVPADKPKKSRLTPDQRRIVRESFERFDDIYRALDD